MSPTQRSLAFLKGMGYICHVTEKWNAFAKIRQDMWGWCDILAIRDKEVMAVQVTSYSNVPARVKKISDSEITPVVRSAGIAINVHGWRKTTRGWEPRIVDLS